MTDSQNPLNVLFADNQAVDLKLLTEIVQPYIQLYRDPPEVDFTLAWQDLPNEKKVLTYLLGRKALSEALNHSEETDFAEKTSPAIIQTETKLPGGTVRPMLKTLKERRFVKNMKGYFVPNTALNEIHQFLKLERVKAE